MQKKGIPREQVFEKLREYKKKDLTYQSGRIMGSMCTLPHPLAVEAYNLFLESNLGDPGLFPGNQALEDETITMLGGLLGNRQVYGHIITGGTEANLMAMRAACNSGKVKKPEVIVPRSAHFSFQKAADMLKFQMKEAELDRDYKVDLESVEELISPRTVAVVGVAGTTELGKIDPIPDLSRLCLEQDLYLHVDAAFGGFIIPFLQDAGYELPRFDFTLEGVSSITIDPHKMGLAPIPTGGILFRDKEHLNAMSIETPYLTEERQSTVVGTRTGASAAATWALLKHLGREGYQEIAKKSMELTHILAQGLEKDGFNLITQPELNIVAFRHPEIPVEDMVSQLALKGWSVSLSSYPQAIRIIVMPHLEQKHINEFLADLDAIKEI
jgi:tyrosine decarboxylase/aspartate 1-decarboxylase